jgi:GntR family transcriptional regulator of arabinose operon
MNEKRWVSIASAIKTAIRSGDLTAGARIASEVEMASQWNVSPVTVHRALSELQREGWVVRRRKAGTVVADRAAHPPIKIALVFTTLSDKPQGSYLSGIEESLAEGHQLLPMSSNSNVRDEAKCLERALAECSAVICYPTGGNATLLNRIASTMPLVLVDRVPEGVEADAIMTDNFGSMLMGLKHLHAQGHTRIAYFMEDQANISSVRERRAAYLEFMKQEIGIADPSRWERKLSASMTVWEQYVSCVEAALAELLTDPEPITAIACQQDSVMSAVLESAVHLGIRLPDDLAVLSFSDNGPRLHLVNAVHRLVQRSAEMGHMAARRIQQRLNAPAATPPQIMRLMTDLYPAKPHVLTAPAQRYVAGRKPA